MIRYDLICGQDHEFDAWFSNSAAFDTQAAGGEIVCPVCGNTNVRKALMAPSIATSRNKGAQGGDGRKGMEAKAALAALMAEVRRHVEANADYVGDRFAEEARAIHNNEAEMRDIYGEATVEEAKALIEEGVSVAPIPGPLKPRH